MTADVISPATAQISVVICVYTVQRWDDIVAAIESVRRQSLTAHELLVVVDHNPDLLARLTGYVASHHDGLAVMVLANRYGQGLSGGKNTGVAVASGNIVAFLDDDAVAEPEWLKYLADCYANPDVAGAGGLTLPNWDSNRPAWLPREFDWVVGCNYKGMTQARQPVRNLLGGNASFRREIFGKAGEFRCEVGRSSARLPLGCEETDFCIRIGQHPDRAILLIDDRAVIWHRVRDERATVRYFLTRCYAEGISKAAVSKRVGSADGLAAERRQAFVVLPAGVVRNLAALLRGDLAALGRAAAIVAGLFVTAAGYLAGRFARG
ncbi:MAG TPA: glycosyltransferase family 2 protein [Streptosporangiaceae bacterium]|nr:glycosyltransferase family 2 protein [Streptosporangiaceae bacterium]